jgi:hypothetical protein
MPASAVKPSEEKYWDEAKDIVKKQYGTTDDHWGVVMTIFKNKVWKHKHREVGKGTPKSHRDRRNERRRLKYHQKKTSSRVMVIALRVARRFIDC